MNVPSAGRLRDTLIASALFFASAAFTLWQNARVAALWDISYLLDSSFRISLGQLPYRDFPFAHAPLTFLLHAAIIRTFGRVYYPHILCAALEAGAATLLTWRILLKMWAPHDHRAPGEVIVGTLPPPHRDTGHARTIATLLTSPLIFLGIYGVYPHPIYDSDAILAVLLTLYLLQHAGESSTRNVIAGAACVLPVFFKQNIGLPFFFAILAVTAGIALRRARQRESISPQTWLFAGGCTAAALALLLLHSTLGLHNYIYWTMTFARQRRLPGLTVMLSVYSHPSLLWTNPAAVAGLVLLRLSARWTRPAAFFLLAAPFLWTLAALILSNDPDDRADQLLSLWPHLLILGAALALWNLRPGTVTFASLLPLILLVTIHGTFLSQQLWGSTYAIWPMLMILVAAMLAQIPALARTLAVTIAATFLICGGLYAISLERLNYIHLDGPETRAALPEFRGLTTPGPWIPNFEELVRFTSAEIPANDGIILLPGEAPFYFATGRTPQFPVLIFDPTTDPYTPQQTLEQARARNIRWLIVSRNLQISGPPPGLPEITRTLQHDFIPYRTLTNYDIYRRK